MKLGNWFAVISAVGFGAAITMSAQGCTVTSGTVTGDGGDLFGDDGGSTTHGDGGDTTHLDGGGTGGDGGQTTVNPCNECLFGACEGQWALCMGDQNCQAIYACAVAPSCITDQNCIDACYNNSTSSQAQSEYVALANCDVQAECTTCGQICGTSGAAVCSADAGPPPGDAGTVQDCNSCTSTNCSNERSACATGTDCDLYTQCLAACTDVACLDKCGTDHASGKTAATALGGCTQQKCASECGL